VREEKSREEADPGFAKREVAEFYTRFMRQNNLNEDSGLPIGTAREIRYNREMDSIRKVVEKLNRKKQNKTQSFQGNQSLKS